MAVDTRPSTLTSIHNYNLRNQGWPTTFPIAADAIDSDPVLKFYEDTGTYPSNADIVYLGKAAAADNAANVGKFESATLKKAITGNTPAPKGHFIINAFDRNRQTVSGIDGIYNPSVDKEDNRPVAVSFYTGRIWYLMPDGKVYYSQVLTEIANASKCYQEADPTAEDINDLIATDGGELDISGISQGLNLIPIRAELAVVADNGVWTISGGADKAFTATDQELRKITNIGSVGSQSVVEAEGTVLYWSEGGIYALVQNDVTGYLEAQNLTENTIQTFYLEIPEISKRYARGYYDKANKKVFWFYNSDSSFDGDTWRYKYDSALIYDFVLKAWYTYSWNVTDYPFLAAMITKAPTSTTTSTEDVTDSGVTVTDGGEDVTSDIALQSTSDVKLKLLTFAETATDTWRYTFSEFNSNDMLDWYTFDDTGVDYSSYIETGHDIAGDLISEKEAGSVYTFFKRTEQNWTEVNDVIDFDYPSSCYMQAKWAWSDSETSGRWSDAQQVYRLLRYYIPSGSGTFDYGFDVIQNISQLRGKGRALSIRFYSEEGYDFHLLGWAIPTVLMTGA